jgi:streptogramin lyase
MSVHSQPPEDSPLRRAPTLVPVAAEAIPLARRIGTPEVRTLLGYTRRVLRLPDQRTLVVFSFSSAAQANWLFLIDSKNLSSRRVPIPNNDIASHGAALGRDGHIYILPYGTGRAYRYVVAENRFEPLEIPLPPGEYTWEAFGASNGRIYFGTYPTACFGEYDPATRRCAIWKQAASDTKYVTGFFEEADGRVRCRAWGPAEVWLVLDPRAGRLERAAPPEKGGGGGALPAPPPEDTGFAQTVAAGTRRFAVSAPSGRLWEIGRDNALRLCGDPRRPAEPWYLEAVPGAVIGISHFGALFRYDLETGRFLRRQLDNRAPAGNAIMFLEAITPRCVIGANYSQQNLFRIDPQTGKIESSEGMVARVTGEPMCAVGFQGRAYLGIYVRSILSVYDPKRRFEPGRNPREIIELGARYAQTRPRAAVTDGEKVYITSDGDYNRLGGALAVIDPKTERVQVYPHLIRDQNLPSLAFDPKTGLLWGGTDRWGQMRSHPPTQPDSLLYAFDPKTRQVAATRTPWPGADVTTVLGVSAGGVLVATDGKEIALIDTARREILYRGASPIGVPGPIRRGSDGFGYTLAGGILYRWDFARNTLTPVARTPGCVHLTEAGAGEWVMANAASVYRWSSGVVE